MSIGFKLTGRHWGVTPVLLLFLGLLVSLYLLSSATENSALIGPYYSWLLLGNAIGLLLLTGLLGYQLYRLYIEYRQKRAGIRLTLRMVTMFVVLAVVPVSLVYLLSVQFLQQKIEFSPPGLAGRHNGAELYDMASRPDYLFGDITFIRQECGLLCKS